MKELQLFINNILDIFIAKESKSKEILNDFIRYFYFTLDKEIESSKSKLLKNKYIMMRKNGLYYIIKNKNEIINTISKKK